MPLEWNTTFLINHKFYKLKKVNINISQCIPLLRGRTFIYLYVLHTHTYTDMHRVPSLT